MKIDPIYIVMSIIMFVLIAVVSELTIYQHSSFIDRSVPVWNNISYILFHLLSVIVLSVIIALFTSNKTAYEKYRYQHIALHTPIAGIFLQLLSIIIFI